MAMLLEEKVRAVERVFDELDTAIASFQSQTQLHCAFGCGKCCYKADIEATALEFLPFAFYLYKQGIATEWFEKISNSPQEVCYILNPQQGGAGLCSQYKHRGLICRLFGYSARTNKYNQKELVTCQIIKTEQAANFGKAVEMIQEGAEVPVMSSYYMQLHAIDDDLARKFYPINVAILEAIKVVLSYYAYRDQ
jgi:Fe-S-cluster containining protein